MIKMVLDERVKHRIMGLVVLISVAAIFIPALIKKSNHYLDQSVNISIRLPAKPSAPKVAVINEKQLFKLVKPEIVSMPKVEAPIVTNQIAKAEPIITKSVLPKAPIINNVPVSNIANNEPVVKKSPMISDENKATKVNQIATQSKKAAAVIVASAKLPNLSSKKSEKNIAVKKEIYAVQLGTFVQQANAKSLVIKLRSKGYIASFDKFTGSKNIEYYKVTVGELNQKNEAVNLKNKLALSMQIEGIIVKKGVS